MWEEDTGVLGCCREAGTRGEAVGVQAGLPRISRLLQVVQ